MKPFTLADIERGGSLPHLWADRSDLVSCPLWWQKQGLQQTASGYGARLTMPEKIHFEGKLRRLYATCFSNCASVWFTFKGETIYIS